MKIAPAVWPASQPIARRALLAAAIGAPLLARAQPATGPLRFGQSIALTGPLLDLGTAVNQGCKAAFAAINARGGVNGRTLELVAEDDGYEPKRAVANVEKFIADRSVFGLLSCMGTPCVAAAMPAVKASGIPFFAPYTGALLARPRDARNVMNVRASYPQEASKLVYHLATVGLTRIGIAYQDNVFGKEVYDGAKVAIDKNKLTDVTAIAVADGAAAIDAALAKFAQAGVKAVLVGMAGKPMADFVKAARAKLKGMPLYTTSVMGSAATIKALGADAVGITVSQVVPLPSPSSAVPIVRDYLRDWAASKTTMEPSHLGLEGYINARALAEVLRRGGAGGRSALIDTTWATRDLDLGGFSLDFGGGPGSNASQFVELTMIGRNGTFLR